MDELWKSEETLVMHLHLEAPKATLPSMPEVINFYHTGKKLYLGFLFGFIPSKWNKKQQSYTHLHH